MGQLPAWPFEQFRADSLIQLEKCGVVLGGCFFFFLHIVFKIIDVANLNVILKLFLNCTLVFQKHKKEVAQTEEWNSFFKKLAVFLDTWMPFTKLFIGTDKDSCNKLWQLTFILNADVASFVLCCANWKWGWTQNWHIHDSNALYNEVCNTYSESYHLKLISNTVAYIWLNLKNLDLCNLNSTIFADLEL